MPPKKKRTTTTGAAAATASQYQGPGLSDMPLLALDEILVQAAILSSTPDVDYRDALTSLSLVCWTWKDIVGDSCFRRRFCKRLIAYDRSHRYHRTTRGVVVAGISSIGQFAILGRELFVLPDARDGTIDVYALENDALDKLRDRQTKNFALKRQLVNDHLRRVHSIHACAFNNNLYFGAYGLTVTTVDVCRVDPVGGQIVKQWAIIVGRIAFDKITIDVDQRTGHVVYPDWRRHAIVELDADGSPLRRLVWNGGSKRVEFTCVFGSTADSFVVWYDVKNTTTRGKPGSSGVRRAVVRASRANGRNKDAWSTQVTGRNDRHLDFRGSYGIDVIDPATGCLLTFDKLADEKGSEYQLCVLGRDLSPRRHINLVGYTWPLVESFHCLDPVTGRLFVRIDNRLEFYDLWRTGLY